MTTYAGDCPKDCPERGTEHMHGNVRHLPPFDPGPDFWDTLDRDRAEWKRLEAAGTPYWCTHEDRDVSHERAYWKPDTWSGPAFDGIHGKHGVMCADCGGYIQEG